MSNLFLVKNLKYLRVKQNYSQEQVAEKLGLTRSAYKEYELEAFPKPELLFKLADFFQISIDDLLRTDLEASELTQEKTKALSLQELKTKDKNILVVTVNNSNKENIEFVPEKAKAGYTSGYANPLYIETLPKFNLPNLSFGTYRAFEIQGDSMPPIADKSIVVGKYVENANYIKNLHTYVLVTKSEGIVYKRIINRHRFNKELILISDNPLYQPYTIPSIEVLEIWAYHCHLSFDGDNEYNKLLMHELLKLVEGIEGMLGK